MRYLLLLLPLCSCSIIQPDELMELERLPTIFPYEKQNSAVIFQIKTGEKSK